MTQTAYNLSPIELIPLNINDAFNKQFIIFANNKLQETK